MTTDTDFAIVISLDVVILGKSSLGFIGFFLLFEVKFGYFNIG